MTDLLNKEDIIKLLPHREPMLLIDQLKNIKKLSSATAIVIKDSLFKVIFLINQMPVFQLLNLWSNCYFNSSWYR